MTKTRDLRALLAVLAAMLLALIAGVVMVRPAVAEMQLVQTKDVTVPGKMTAPPYDVDTGIDLKPGDRLVVSASGRIWPGCVLCPDNGPEGENTTADNRFPLPGVREYSLLGKVNGSYFYIGSGKDMIHQGGPGRLSLRINDYIMDDNNGSFTAHISVYRDVQPPSQCSDGKDNDGDGKIDFGTGANNDPGCTSAADNDETDPGGGSSTDTTPPTIVPIAPAPGSQIKNGAPLISATIRDDKTDLDGSNIKLFVDGSEKTASYDKANDKLTCKSAKLARGQHTVKIEATDASGLKGQNTWNFKVVRRH
jgi:hypothetical protein